MRWLRRSVTLVLTCGFGVAACATSSDDTGVSGAGGGPGACQAGQTTCSGVCVLTASDPSNCGACGVNCLSGQACSQGKCTSSGCSGGMSDCSGSCVDLLGDPAHCGACGNACASGQVCAQGQCGSSCGSGTTQCGSQCVDLSTNPDNCGSCGNTCAAGQGCQAGQCGTSCGSGLALCGTKCADLQIDPANCGSCGSACPSGESCVGGTCQLVCAGGSTNCNNECVDTELDPSHCGGCGNACSTGESCVAGVCTVVCSAGQLACSGTCVDPSTDPSHCGGCGNACTTSQTCQGGVCVSSCNPTTNVALTATASSSGGGVVSSGVGPDRMNDGHSEAECTAYKFHWVDAGSSPGTEYIQLDWSSAVTVKRIVIDTTLATATTCGVSSGRSTAGGTVQYWTGSTWSTVGTVSGKTDDWSFDFPTAVQTTRIRLYGIHATNSTGQKSNPVVFEWQVFSC